MAKLAQTADTIESATAVSDDPADFGTVDSVQARDVLKAPHARRRVSPPPPGRRHEGEGGAASGGPVSGLSRYNANNVSGNLVENEE
ncbi:hypothetical protein, partial [Streptomyces sp. NPDC059828]|uniref:hypothetical protein n=1 Tax=Streptomyces sp. NPDC059828 TaxID=3346965 RepID=UPI00365E7B64